MVQGSYFPLRPKGLSSSAVRASFSILKETSNCLFAKGVTSTIWVPSMFERPTINSASDVWPSRTDAMENPESCFLAFPMSSVIGIKTTDLGGGRRRSRCSDGVGTSSFWIGDSFLFDLMRFRRDDHGDHGLARARLESALKIGRAPPRLPIAPRRSVPILLFTGYQQRWCDSAFYRDLFFKKSIKIL
ncbi:hypothetical protein IHE45_05G141200 [Dioscorea alata]|uniref:Uncharacterized protein n=1 Tax=Dioscorea alata TaxID=55571 RepID=A0ACB7W503_DIOAL|nr:hypothetical protein IHE45_05G141200 [Dioscorea alata]